MRWKEAGFVGTLWDCVEDVCHELHILPGPTIAAESCRVGHNRSSFLALLYLIYFTKWNVCVTRFFLKKATDPVETDYPIYILQDLSLRSAQDWGF